MFGSEQACVQSRAFLKYLYRLIGEFRFPLRLRGHYLAQAIPPDFLPEAIWDAGCGAGHTSFYLARRFPMAKVLGTDLNPQMIKRCRQIVERSGATRLKFDAGDLAETKYENVYDLVICFEVLEHIEDYDVAVRNLSASLKPGGHLIIHSPAAGRFQESDFGIRQFRSISAYPATLERGQYHVRPGFQLADLAKAFERREMIIERAEHTFGVLAMHAHTIYELTRSHPFYAFATFPLLMGGGLVDWHLPRHEGGGLLLRARKVQK